MLFYRPFHYVKHIHNISKGRNCPAARLYNVTLCTVIVPRPFHCVTHKRNVSKGRSSQRRHAAGLEFDGIGGKVFLNHESDFEDDCMIKLSQVKTCELLYLIQSVNQCVSVYEKLS